MSMRQTDAQRPLTFFYFQRNNFDMEEEARGVHLVFLISTSMHLTTFKGYAFTSHA